MPLKKEELKVIVGKKIRQVRLMKNLTIEKVANTAGIEYTQLSRIEHGKINTSIYHVYIISQSLDIDLPELFTDLKKYERQRPETV
jgi:transcriptional regulator with XRE-family HTH domain